MQTTKPAFTFAKRQKVYIVSVDSNSRNAGMTKADLELERYAKNAFRRHRVFKVASTLRDSDLVFFVMLDADSGKIDEVAVVVWPSDYQEANGNLDALRNAAVWQSDNHFRSAGAEAALATFTAGMSLIFHADVVAGLVKQFHKDTLGK